MNFKSHFNGSFWEGYGSLGQLMPPAEIPQVPVYGYKALFNTWQEVGNYISLAANSKSIQEYGQKDAGFATQIKKNSGTFSR